MAKKAAKPKRKHILLTCIVILFVLLLALCGWMKLMASIVHLEFAELALSDLPHEFDGMRILFVSDLHADATNPAGRALKLMDELMETNPDMLILGGDYTGPDIASLFVGDDQATQRAQLFAGMNGYDPPLGKFCVPGNHDLDLDDAQGLSLADSAEMGGFVFLQNSAVSVERNGSRLILAGLDDWKKGKQEAREIARGMSIDDCVILVSHNPDALPVLNNQPGKDGTGWIDLMLTGHTHGGQVRLFGGSPLFNSSIYKDRFLTGWHLENGTKMLISNGVGTTFVDFRLGAPAQAHLITLRQMDPGQ